MESAFTIRHYQHDDYDAIIALWKSLGLGSEQRGDNRDVIERTICAGGKLLVMVDLVTQKIMGTSWLTVDGRRTYLHHFGIAENQQGQGLAKMLLSESLKEAGKIGLQLKLEVHRDNMKALGLYEKAGFSYLGDYLVYIIRDISKL